MGCCEKEHSPNQRGGDEREGKNNMLAGEMRGYGLTITQGGYYFKNGRLYYKKDPGVVE